MSIQFGPDAGKIDFEVRCAELERERDHLTDALAAEQEASRLQRMERNAARTERDEARGQVAAMRKMLVRLVHMGRSQPGTYSASEEARYLDEADKVLDDAAQAAAARDASAASSSAREVKGKA